MAVKKSAKKPVAKAASKKTSTAKTGVRGAAKPVKKTLAKSTVKKAAPTKAAGKKSATSKVAAKKVAAKKPVAKKPLVSKSAVSKTSAPKAVTKAKKAAKPAQVQTKAVKPAAANTKAAKVEIQPVSVIAISGKKKPVVSRESGAKAGYVKPAKPKEERMKVSPVIERVVLPQGYLPRADEEYMNAYQLEYFRQRLLTWRTELVEESLQTIENLKEEVRDVGDEAERATRETENSLELRTRDRYRKLINKIDSTIRRIDEGDYGFCVDTGEPIGLERLSARLTAERTIDAQERWEHLQKQMGD